MTKLMGIASVVWAVQEGEVSMDTKSTDKVLISIKEMCNYLGIGETKARELIRGHNGFGVRIGNRWYANKTKLDEWINNMTL